MDEIREYERKRKQEMDRIGWMNGIGLKMFVLCPYYTALIASTHSFGFQMTGPNQPDTNIVGKLLHFLIAATQKKRPSSKRCCKIESVKVETVTVEVKDWSRWQRVHMIWDMQKWHTTNRSKFHTWSDIGDGFGPTIVLHAVEVICARVDVECIRIN